MKLTTETDKVYESTESFVRSMTREKLEEQLIAYIKMAKFEQEMRNTVSEQSKPIIKLEGADEFRFNSLGKPENIKCLTVLYNEKEIRKDYSYEGSPRAETIISFLCNLRDAGAIDLITSDYWLNNYTIQR
jgi:hypothetical protein